MGQTREERIVYLRRRIREALAQESYWLKRARQVTPGFITDHYIGVCHARATQYRVQAQTMQRRLELMKEK